MNVIKIDPNDSSVCVMFFKGSSAYARFDKGDYSLVKQHNWSLIRNGAGNYMVRQSPSGAYLHRFILQIAGNKRIRMSKNNPLAYLDCTRKVLLPPTQPVQQQSNLPPLVPQFRLPPAKFQARDHHFLDCAAWAAQNKKLYNKQRQILMAVGHGLRYGWKTLSQKQINSAKLAFRMAIKQGYNPNNAQPFSGLSPSSNFIVI